MLKGHIHAGSYPRGGGFGIWGTRSRKYNLWELKDLLDSTKELFKEIYVSSSRIR